MTVTDARTRHRAPKIARGSQVIFGERVHLLEVLHSIEKAKIPLARKRSEIRALKGMIAARTQELNRITYKWDWRFRKARDPHSTSEELVEIAAALSPKDYLMARVLSEHPQAPDFLLAHLASHPYAAVRENVARHPSTPAPVLRRLAENPKEPLWFLVACNPSAPTDLRERLRARMRPGS